MKGLYSCIIAISMYSRLPMPKVEWRKERMAYVMCCFPIVGLLEGAALALWFWLGMKLFRFTALFTALAGAAVPLLVTGGIHMDGFLDTMDALHSYGDRERKLNILKDPHIGAFAVIGMAVYMLIYTGILYEYTSILACAGVRGRSEGMLYFLPAVVFTMERSFSGLSVVAFPLAKQEGLAAGFAAAAKKRMERLALLAWVAFCVLASALFGIWGLAAGLAVLSVQLLVFAWYYRMSWRKFGGVTGDLAGFFLQVCEAVSFGILVLFAKLVVIGGLAG